MACEPDYSPPVAITLVKHTDIYGRPNDLPAAYKAFAIASPHLKGPYVPSAAHESALLGPIRQRDRRAEDGSEMLESALEAPQSK